jgi:hypothetical protein
MKCGEGWAANASDKQKAKQENAKEAEEVETMPLLSASSAFSCSQGSFLAFL